MPERNIAEYFDLPYQEKERMSITLKKHPIKPENCVLLTVKYSLKNHIENIQSIPVELLRIVYSYASHEYIQLTFKIIFPVDYPFAPPTWSLEEEKNNLSFSALNHTTIRDYFQELTNVHNEQYRRNSEEINFTEEELSKMSDFHRKRTVDYYYWSPAFTIEKDILCFINRINHFQYILQPDCPLEKYTYVEKKNEYQTKPSWRFIVLAD